MELLSFFTHRKRIIRHKCLRSESGVMNCFQPNRLDVGAVRSVPQVAPFAGWHHQRRPPRQVVLLHEPRSHSQVSTDDTTRLLGEQTGKRNFTKRKMMTANMQLLFICQLYII